MDRHRHWLFSGLTILLALLASGVGGRALWCDEVLRIFGQQMTVDQLIHYEHLKTFCTQSPIAYFLYRPWQHALGMETGGFIASALCAGVVTLATLISLKRVFGKEPPLVISFIIATNPLLLYYGSELAFYILWAACCAALFALIVARPEKPHWRHGAALVTAATLFISVHFAGMFIWVGIAGALFVTSWMTGGRAAALRRIPLLAIPALINLPLYVTAMQAPKHLTGATAIHWNNIVPVAKQLGIYFATFLPSLTGGWWIGGSLLAVGAAHLLYTRKADRRDIVIVGLATIASILLFMGYSLLRNYSYFVCRYWVYALSPALFFVGAGLLAMTTSAWRPRVARSCGWSLAALLAALNVINAGALLSVAGRPCPYTKLVNYIRGLPQARTLVCMNYYENRFLGGYYPVPNNATRLSPATYEEGKEARIRGAQKILKLVPDALVFVNGDESREESRQAGFLFPEGFVYHPPKLMDWALKLRVFPEPSSRPYPYALVHETRDAVAARSATSGSPATLPASGFRTVSFRNGQGELFFGLLTPSQIEFSVFVPEQAQLRPAALEVLGASYRPTSLAVSVDGRPGDQTHPQFGAIEAQGYYIPQKQSFKGFPNPDYLALDGMNFVLAFQPQLLRIPLGVLKAGWHTVSLASAQKSPWMILAHTPVTQQP